MKTAPLLIPSSVSLFQTTVQSWRMMVLPGSTSSSGKYWERPEFNTTLEHAKGVVRHHHTVDVNASRDLLFPTLSDITEHFQQCHLQWSFPNTPLVLFNMQERMRFLSETHITEKLGSGISTKLHFNKLCFVLCLVQMPME